jgi:hypothetical protein
MPAPACACRWCERGPPIWVRRLRTIGREQTAVEKCDIWDGGVGGKLTVAEEAKVDEGAI